jgi:hypothetical protein
MATTSKDDKGLYMYYIPIFILNNEAQNLLNNNKYKRNIFMTHIFSNWTVYTLKAPFKKKKTQIGFKISDPDKDF